MPRHSSAETADLGSAHVVSFSHVFVSLCSRAQPNLTGLSIPFIIPNLSIPLSNNL